VRNPIKENAMRTKLKLIISILALSQTTGVSAQSIDWKTLSEPFISSAHAQSLDWQKVDDTLGRKPAVSGDVRRYGFPRSDLTVTLDDVPSSRPSRSADGLRSSRCMAKQW